MWRDRNGGVYPKNASCLRIASINVDVHNRGPGLKGSYPVESHHGDANKAEVEGIVAAEKGHAQNGEKIEDKDQENNDVSNSTEAFHETHHDNFELLNFSDELQKPHKSEQTEERDINSRDWNPANNNN